MHTASPFFVSTIEPGVAVPYYFASYEQAFGSPDWRPLRLCRGATKTGKQCYYFAREPRDEPVEQLPEAYTMLPFVSSEARLVGQRVAAVDQLDRGAWRQQPALHEQRVRQRGQQVEMDPAPV